MDKREVIMKELSDQKLMLEEKGYKVAGIFLYGSQNYDLDIYTEDYHSDIDAKAIIIPTLDDLVNNAKPVSTKIITDVGEIDVKDIRIFTEVLLKANPSYLEVLFTEYYIVDHNYCIEVKEMRSKAEYLVWELRLQLVKSMYGMILEKQKALCHPYPSTAHKIQKYGYDGKQLSHMSRLLKMMTDYFSKKTSYEQALIPTGLHREIMISYKLNEVSINEAIDYSNQCVDNAKTLKDLVLCDVANSDIGYSYKNEYLKVSQDIIKKKIISDVIQDCVNGVSDSIKNRYKR